MDAVTSAAPLRLNLLGSFAVTWRDQPLDGFNYDKMRALLAYLSLEYQREHSRETLAALLDHVDDVAVHEVGVEAVDAHRHHLVAPVDVAQGLDDVLARLRLVVRRDGVLEVEEDDVGRRLGGLLEQ